MAWNPKKALKNTGVGRVGRGLDKIVRESILEGKGAPAYKEGLDDVAKGIYGVGSKDVAKADPLAPSQEAKRKAQAEAEAKVKQAAGRYDDIALPEFTEQYALPEELVFQELALQGYTPEEAEAAVQGDARFSNIEVDPRFQESQLAALAATEGLAQTGMTAQDEANLARIQSDVGRADRGRREAIQDRMRRQGMAGSGLDLLAQLSSGQAATDRASQAGLDIAGQASQRQRQAIIDQANMASGVRGQSFEEQARAAAAQDAIDQFNAANRQQINLANQQAANHAAQFGAQTQNTAAQANWQGQRDTDLFNLQGRQNVAQSNVDLARQNKQQAFDNQMGLRGAQANSDLGLANQYQRSADRAAQKEGQIIGGLGQLAGAGAQYVLSDENKKTDIRPMGDQEIVAFMDSIQPKKFKYKNEANGAGDRVGVMAQDIDLTQSVQQSYRILRRVKFSITIILWAPY